MAEAQQRDGQVEGAEGGPLQLYEAIAGFIPAVSHYLRTFFGTDLPEQDKISFRNVLAAWNRFVVEEQGAQHTGALVSRDFPNDIQKFISSPLNTSSYDASVIRGWLAYWNVFLLARQDESPVTKCGAMATALGVLLFVVDMATDLGTAVYFTCSGHWWLCAATFLIVYAAVAISTAYKLAGGAVVWSGPCDTLRYLVSLLVSWPDLRACWALLHVEWELAFAPRSGAHLVPVWQERRLRVAALKLIEGVCEGCPQALLQLVLLLPDLQGDITGTVYMRMVSTATSLCAAGAALVYKEKVVRFYDHAAPSSGELALLHVWAVPVTVSRLLCLALLLSVHLYSGLACMALHVALGILLISPFDNSVTRRCRTVRHVIHFLGNTGVTVAWALTTSLHCTQPVLYAALISSVFVTFLIGVLGCGLHWKHWPLHN